MQTQSNTLSFEGKNIYVGFDVHAKDWKVSIMVEKVFHKTFIQQPGAEALHKYLCSNFPYGIYHSVYEAGFSGFYDHFKLQKLGVNSIVVNPADVPTTGKEMIQKTDKRDSLKLVKGLLSGELKGIYIPQPETLHNRLLLRTRAQFVKDLTRNKNRIKSQLHFLGIRYPEEFFNSRTHWSGRFMRWLQQLEMDYPNAKVSLNLLVDQVISLRSTLLNITKQIRELSTSEQYKANYTLIKSIPGIGLISGMTILLEIEDIHRFPNSISFFSYVGIIPSTHSSGEKDSIGKMTPRGHPVLRNLLIECAWVSVRQDPSLLKKHLENCKRMPANKSIIHIARNLASRIRFVLVNKVEYKKGI